MQGWLVRENEKSSPPPGGGIENSHLSTFELSGCRPVVFRRDGVIVSNRILIDCRGDTENRLFRAANGDPASSDRINLRATEREKIPPSRCQSKEEKPQECARARAHSRRVVSPTGAVDGRARARPRIKVRRSAVAGHYFRLDFRLSRVCFSDISRTFTNIVFQYSAACITARQRFTYFIRFTINPYTHARNSPVPTVTRVFPPHRPRERIIFSRVSRPPSRRHTPPKTCVLPWCFWPCSCCALASSPAR